MKNEIMLRSNAQLPDVYFSFQFRRAHYPMLTILASKSLFSSDAWEFWFFYRIICRWRNDNMAV